MLEFQAKGTGKLHTGTVIGTPGVTNMSTLNSSNKKALTTALCNSSIPSTQNRGPSLANANNN